MVSSPRAEGFTYLALLFWVALIGVGLAALGEFWSTASRREKEAELLFVGEQFRRAIVAYQAVNKGRGDGLPQSLEALLGDAKDVPLRRYLRKVFVDPMTGTNQWGLLRSPTGGIQGVYSLSEERPFRETGFPPESGLTGGSRYSDWKFAVPGAAEPPQKQSSEPPRQLTAEEKAALVAEAEELRKERQGVQDQLQDPRSLDCAAISRRDASTCDEVRRDWGNAQFYQCNDSATVRRNTCVAQNGKPPLPPLWIP